MDKAVAHMNNNFFPKKLVESQKRLGKQKRYKPDILNKYIMRQEDIYEVVYKLKTANVNCLLE